MCKKPSAYAACSQSSSRLAVKGTTAPWSTGYAMRGLLLLGNSDFRRLFSAVPRVWGCPEAVISSRLAIEVLGALLDGSEGMMGACMTRTCPAGLLLASSAEPIEGRYIFRGRCLSELPGGRSSFWFILLYAER
jgi:hypothetical protein